MKRYRHLTECSEHCPGLTVDEEGLCVNCNRERGFPVIISSTTPAREPPPDSGISWGLILGILLWLVILGALFTLFL